MFNSNLLNPIVVDTSVSAFCIVHNRYVIYNYYAYYGNPISWLEQVHALYFNSTHHHSLISQKFNHALWLNLHACSLSATITSHITSFANLNPNTNSFANTSSIAPEQVQTHFQQQFSSHNKFSGVSSNYWHYYFTWQNYLSHYRFYLDLDIVIPNLDPLYSYGYVSKPSFNKFDEVQCSIAELGSHIGFKIERTITASTLNPEFYVPNFHVLPVYVFCKRSMIEKNLTSVPSRFAQYKIAHSRQIPVINLRTLSIHQNLENPYIHVYLRNAFDGYANQVDLVLSLLKPEQFPSSYNNYVMHPTYIRELLLRYGFPTLAELKDIFQSLENKRVKSISERPYFCGQVSNHDNINGWQGVRYDIIKAIDTVIKPLGQVVLCGGKFLNNTDMLKKECNDNKILFLQKFIFNICPENSWTPGYVTEKIFDCYEGGSVPVYWGCLDHDLDIFNLDAIVYFNPRKVDTFKQQIYQLFTDAQALTTLIQQPIFKVGAAEVFFCRYLAPLYRQLELLTNQSLNMVRKNRLPLPDNYAWQDDYLQAKATLIELGHNPVDMQDHLFDNDRYQWPFLKADRVRVATRYRPLHAEFTKFDQQPIAHYDDAIAPKPFFDSVESTVRALDQDRQQRAILRARTQRILALDQQASNYYSQPTSQISNQTTNQDTNNNKLVGTSQLFNASKLIATSEISSIFGKYKVLSQKLNYNLDLATYQSQFHLSQIPLYCDYYPQWSQPVFSINYINQATDYSLNALNLIFKLSFSSNSNIDSNVNNGINSSYDNKQFTALVNSLSQRFANATNNDSQSINQSIKQSLSPTATKITKVSKATLGASVKDQLASIKHKTLTNDQASVSSNTTQLASSLVSGLSANCLLTMTNLSTANPSTTIAVPTTTTQAPVTDVMSDTSIVNTVVASVLTHENQANLTVEQLDQMFNSASLYNFDSSSYSSSSTVSPTAKTVDTKGWHAKYLSSHKQQAQVLTNLTQGKVKVADFTIASDHSTSNSSDSNQVLSQTGLDPEFIKQYLTPPALSTKVAMQYAYYLLAHIYCQDQATLHRRQMLDYYINQAYTQGNLSQAQDEIRKAFDNHYEVFEVQVNQLLRQVAQMPYLAQIKLANTPLSQLRVSNNHLSWQACYRNLTLISGKLVKNRQFFKTDSQNLLPKISYSYTNLNQRYLLTKFEQAQGLSWTQRKARLLARTKVQYQRA